MIDPREIPLLRQGEKASLNEQALAERLGNPIVSFDELSHLQSSYYLAFSPEGLALVESAKGSAKPTRVNFISSALAQRATDGIKKQNLIKSLGLKRNPAPLVLDAMAGLGKDAYLMTCAGARVLMLERSPVIHALLEDGLQRLREGQHAGDFNNLSLEHGEFLEFRPPAGSIDIVYLDPMYPGSQRKSKAKADMSRLHDVLGVSNNESMVFDHALHIAKRRVIIKRPKSAEVLAGKQPDICFKGSSARFDVYLNT